MGYAVWLFPNRDTPLNSESVRIVFSVKSGGKTIAPLNYAAKVLVFIDMYKFFVKKNGNDYSFVTVFLCPPRGSNSRPTD